MKGRAGVVFPKNTYMIILSLCGIYKITFDIHVARVFIYHFLRKINFCVPFKQFKLWNDLNIEQLNQESMTLGNTFAIIRYVNFSIRHAHCGSRADPPREFMRTCD